MQGRGCTRTGQQGGPCCRQDDADNGNGNARETTLVMAMTTATQGRGRSQMGQRRGTLPSTGQHRRRYGNSNRNSNGDAGEGTVADGTVLGDVAIIRTALATATATAAKGRGRSQT